MIIHYQDMIPHYQDMIITLPRYDITLPRYDNLKNLVVSDLKRMTKQNRDLMDSLLKSGLDNLINSVRF